MLIKFKLTTICLLAVAVVLTINLIVDQVNYILLWYKYDAIIKMRALVDKYLADNPQHASDATEPVPNIVHYILFTIHKIEFGHFLSILSVLKVQKPDLIYIHCDCHTLSGHYWERSVRMANRTGTTIIIRHIERPTEIYGYKVPKQWLNWHSSDLTRIAVMTEFGGIYLDRDVYVVQPLHPLMHNEITIDFQLDILGSQVIICRKNATFLKLWIQSYRFYLTWEWYFNVGSLPTAGIIAKHPYLVHRVDGMFGAHGPSVCPYLYNKYRPDWRSSFYAVHLVIRGDSIGDLGWCFNSAGKVPEVTKFNENICRSLTNTFGEMCREAIDFETITLQSLNY